MNFWQVKAEHIKTKIYHQRAGSLWQLSRWGSCNGWSGRCRCTWRRRGCQGPEDSSTRSRFQFCPDRGRDSCCRKRSLLPGKFIKRFEIQFFLWKALEVYWRNLKNKKSILVLVSLIVKKDLVVCGKLSKQN